MTYVAVQYPRPGWGRLAPFPFEERSSACVCGTSLSLRIDSGRNAIGRTLSAPQGLSALPALIFPINSGAPQPEWVRRFRGYPFWDGFQGEPNRNHVRYRYTCICIYFLFFGGGSPKKDTHTHTPSLFFQVLLWPHDGQMHLSGFQFGFPGNQHSSLVQRVNSGLVLFNATPRMLIFLLVSLQNRKQKGTPSVCKTLSAYVSTIPPTFLSSSSVACQGRQDLQGDFEVTEIQLQLVAGHYVRAQISFVGAVALPAGLSEKKGGPALVFATKRASFLPGTLWT